MVKQQASDSQKSSCLLSVVVCTYNRADLVRSILQDLCKQTLEPIEYEVLIIDNNSSDYTQSIVEEVARRHPNVRYICETQQGHTYARNRGWREAQGQYIAYADDDCQIPPQWLECAKSVIQHVAPIAFGGPYFAAYNTPKPNWFQDRYASHNYGESARPLLAQEYLDGMNIFFRRSVFLQLGGFKTDLGMRGMQIGYGDETEYLIRIRTMLPDAIIYYDPTLFVYHLVRSEKMTFRWIARSLWADGRYTYQMFQARHNPSPVDIFTLVKATIKTFKYIGIELIFGLPRRDRHRYPYPENYLFEKTFKHIRTLATFYEQLQSRRNR